jgi:hypothetical protein
MELTEPVGVDFMRSPKVKGLAMRVLLMAGTVGLMLTVGAARADSQTALFRPALDAIGNAQPSAAEGVAQTPDGADFALDDQGAPARRGKVTIESATTPPVNNHSRRRHLWAIPTQ